MSEQTQTTEGDDRPWPANTPMNRKDTGCYRVAPDPDDPEDEYRGLCWCGAPCVAGFGECEQCRGWID